MGVTSIKAYEHIDSTDLAATIDTAHARGLKVTAHLCAVSYPEAIALGIDNIEHGFFANSQLFPERQPDVCTPGSNDVTSYFMTPDNPARAELIASLVENDVAVTSTLGVFEGYSPDLRIMSDAALSTLTPTARNDYMTTGCVMHR